MLKLTCVCLQATIEEEKLHDFVKKLIVFLKSNQRQMEIDDLLLFFAFPKQ